MPPVVKTSIMPMHATSGTAACLTTVRMFRTVKKFPMNRQAHRKITRKIKMLPCALAKAANPPRFTAFCILAPPYIPPARSAGENCAVLISRRAFKSIEKATTKMMMTPTRMFW